MDRRKESRSSTQDSVRVRLAGRSLRCRMRNLSRSGCLIECDTMLVEVGTPVEVVLSTDCVAAGEVAWQLGANFGVRFTLPIPAALVREYAIEDWPMKAAAKQFGPDQQLKK